MGMGALASLFGNAVIQSISASEKNDLASDQKRKAAQLEQQANAIVPQQEVNTPAYRMKAFLAAAGVPGFEQYKQEFEQSEQNALATAEKVAPSGGSLLETLGALESSKNKQITALNSKNAAYIDSKKIDLADTLQSQQDKYDEIARQEKSKLNYAATQYENAAAEQHQAAQEQELGAVGSSFSGLGSLMNLGQQNKGAVPTFGGGSGGVDMSSIASLMSLLD